MIGGREHPPATVAWAVGQEPGGYRTPGDDGIPEPGELINGELESAGNRACVVGLDQVKAMKHGESVQLGPAGDEGIDGGVGFRGLAMSEGRIGFVDAQTLLELALGDRAEEGAGDVYGGGDGVTDEASGQDEAFGFQPVWVSDEFPGGLGAVRFSEDPALSDARLQQCGADFLRVVGHAPGECARIGDARPMDVPTHSRPETLDQGEITMDTGKIDQRWRVGLLRRLAFELEVFRVVQGRVRGPGGGGSSRFGQLARFEEALELAVVHFSGAEQRDLPEVTDLSWHAEVGESAGFDRSPDFLEGEPGLIGDGDEHLPFVGVGSGDHRYHAAGSVLWEGAGERVFDGSQADHFAADFGESFQSAEDMDEA